MTSLYKTREGERTDTQKRRPRDDRGCDGGDAATSQGVPAAPRSWKSQGRILPRVFGGSTALLTTSFLSSSLQNCERAYFKHPVYGNLLQQLQKTYTNHKPEMKIHPILLVGSPSLSFISEGGICPNGHKRKKEGDLKPKSQRPHAGQCPPLRRVPAVVSWSLSRRDLDSKPLTVVR